MTFRIQRSTVDDALVLMLSGDIAGDHTADLETLVDASGTRPMVLDLKDVSVVDRRASCCLPAAKLRIDPAELSFIRPGMDSPRTTVRTIEQRAGRAQRECSMASV